MKKTAGLIILIVLASLVTDAVKISAETEQPTWLTYLGGNGNESFGYILQDHNGNIVICGSTVSADYPVTAGAYSTSLQSGTDIVVSRLDPELKRLLASTFINGGGSDIATCIVEDAGGNYIVAGRTSSQDLPVTAGAYAGSNSGGAYDVFILKIDSTLSTVTACTYLGGNGEDGAESVAVAENGNIYVSGYTHSSGFPTTAGVYDTSHNGGKDGFVACFSSDLSTLIASTFLGGSGMDAQDSDCKIAVRGSTVVVVGTTASTNFPVTNGSADTTYGGNGDGFLAIFNDSLTDLQAATFVGGSAMDWVHGFAVDDDGNVFAAIHTDSADLPVTDGSSLNPVGMADTAVFKFNADLSAISAGRYLGGSDNDNPWHVTVDSGGTPVVAGFSVSPDFPVTEGAFQTALSSSNYDGYVVRYDEDLGSVIGATLFGGSADDSCSSAIFGSNGDIYVFGTTGSADLSAGADAYDTTLGNPANGSTSGEDFFIFRINPTLTEDRLLPDIANKKLRFKPKKFGLGDSVKITSIFKNEGDAASLSCPVSYYLSTNNKWDKKDTHLGSGTVDALAAGKKKKIVTTVDIPANLKPKGYYLISVYDPDSVNSESSVKNNVKVSAKKILVN